MNRRLLRLNLINGSVMVILCFILFILSYYVDFENVQVGIEDKKRRLDITFLFFYAMVWV